MKKLIILLSLLIPSIALAEGGLKLFAADDGGVAGISIDARLSHGLFISKADLSFVNDLGGVGLSLGVKAGDFNIFLGRSKIDGETQHAVIDIDGKNATGGGEGNGYSDFLEIEYKRVFIRYHIYNLNYVYKASRIVGTDQSGNSIIANGYANGSRAGKTLWIGAKFPF